MKQIFTLKLVALTLVGILITTSSCKTSKTAKGAAIGALAGGAIGGLIGHKSGNTAVGVLAGAAIGGTAGALIGRKMDKQAAELQRELEGATIQRVGEGILITFNEGMRFDVNSAHINSASTSNIDDLSRILTKYADTDILIEGHTDSSGSDEYNQSLSVKRAEAVKSILARGGVVVSRMSSIGYGESQPLEDNSTAAGKAANRRVEVAIYANKKMKRMAEKGQL